MLEGLFSKVMGADEAREPDSGEMMSVNFPARVDTVLLMEALQEAEIRGANILSGREMSEIRFPRRFREKVMAILSDLGRVSQH